MSALIAIDPGPTESAFVHFVGDQITDFGIWDNADLERHVAALAKDIRRLVIEKVEGYGMAVGKSVFETVYWSGRFAALWDEYGGQPAERIGRKAVKIHLCGQTKAKDSNIRQALIDRYGGIEGKAKAVGTNKAPGPLYGVSKDVWAALALGVTALDWQRVTELKEGTG